MTVSYIDPSIRWADRTVRLRFMVEDCTAEFVVKTGGNIPGLNLASCLAGVSDLLPVDEDGLLGLKLANGQGREIVVWQDLEDLDSEEWLSGMLVAAEMLTHENGE